jgi:Fic family protein
MEFDDQTVYIHDLKEWPSFTWDAKALAPLISDVQKGFKRLEAELDKAGFDQQSEASLRGLTDEVVKTSEIEGEQLDPAQVRSSIAIKLGLPTGGLQKEDRSVEGIVNVVLDATQKCSQPLTKERLCNWHRALFPTGYSGLNKISVGAWREGPMQVVSGRIGNPTVFFEAPAAVRLELEMDNFITWFKDEKVIDPILKAGIAHLYFVTIHPFDDGNGRIARAIADLALANADQMKQRYYSMSAQIRIDRNGYYDTLEATQKGNLDITKWLEWFLKCLIRALNGAEVALQDILQKARVWQHLEDQDINERQRRILNLFLDKTWFGNLTSKKYSQINNCSADTANRDLLRLEQLGVFKREGKGKATHYIMVLLPAA